MDAQFFGVDVRYETSVKGAASMVRQVIELRRIAYRHCVLNDCVAIASCNSLAVALRFQPFHPAAAAEHR